MPLAELKYFSCGHIEAHRQQAPAILAELAVHALELVAELVREGLRFRFKGGNSMLVLLSDPRRFSIDVDISTDETAEKIEDCLSRAIAKHGVFKRWAKRQHKTKPWLPMTSYEVFFYSHFNDGRENFVMLDAVLHNSLYASIKKSVSCAELYKSNEICELPAVASLLADKLLTLGPNTLGIPLGKKKEAQRLKHVHDVSLLASKNPCISDLREALVSCLKQENELQERSLTPEQICEDTLLFCRIPSMFAEEPLADPSDALLGEIISGRKPFAEHLFSGEYPWPHLQTDAARAALCFAAALKMHVTEKMFWDALNADSFPASEAFHPALGRSNPQACFYWKKIFDWTQKNYLAP